MFKSKTINFAYLLAILGVVEQNFGMVSNLLGKYQGVFYILIAGIVAILRIWTTQPLSEK